MFFRKKCEFFKKKVPVLEGFLSNFTVPFLPLEQKCLPPGAEIGIAPEAHFLPSSAAQQRAHVC